MRTICGRLRQGLLFSLFLVLFSLGGAGVSAQVQPRITQVVDNARRVTLAGNTHPLARAEFDRGAAPSDLPLERMLLVLKPSEAQQAELQKLLDDQQDAHSPAFRKWLTPDEFGQRFGVSDSDIRTITDWLSSQGLRVEKVYRGRTLIEFSGTAGQVQQAFGTAIHQFVMNGESHWANANDQQIPEALAPVVAGVLTLHNFYKKTQLHVVQGDFTAKVAPGAKPQFTSSTGKHALVPADYNTIYNFNPLQLRTSAKIAIVGRSNINVQDIDNFNGVTSDYASDPQIVLNGPDPGDLGGGEELEAVLDSTWSGAVAPSASVYLVISQSTAASDGADLSEAYIIDNNAWDVMSESFGNCEAGFTSAQAAGVSNLAQQAAAQGITYVVAAGDSGSAGCDDPHSETTATHPPSVNLLASTPYTVAVGGTMFNEHGVDAQYWSSTNTQPSLGSAISYIPENVWNESCAATQSPCSTPSIWAGGGGASTYVTKPSWQTGVAGIPADHARDLPDVSLTASSHDPYLICIDSSCVPDAQGVFHFAGVSGTSASTPAFAGIMALVGQTNMVRLGQPNYVLYRLAAAEKLSSCNASSITVPVASNCIFNDVTVGNNAVPGVPGYGTPTAPYQSGTGYDLATGLGSVNVSNLISQWNSVTFNATTTNFSITPATAVHGTPLNVTVQVSPTSGTGTPSGYIWLVQNGYPQGNFVGDSTADTFALTAGSFTGTTCLLPGGNYQVHAHYAGDGTYGGSDSTPLIQVAIQAEPTTVAFSVLTTGPGGTMVPFTGGPYGTPVYLQANLGWSSHCGTPSSYVNFWDNNSGVSQAYPDKNGNALSAPLILPAGMHSITAGYYGDNSFASSANLTPAAFTIGQVATSTTVTSQQTGQSLMLTAFVGAPGAGNAPTGTVTFNSGSTVLGGASLMPVNTTGGVQAMASFDGSQLAPGQYNVVANYPGDTNYTPSVSTPMPLNLVADFVVASRGITSQIAIAGQPASYVNDIGVTPLFGFSAAVTLSCSTTAPAATCSITPNSIAGANGIASVTVTTTMRSSGIFGGPGNRWPLQTPMWPATLWAMLLMTGAALLAVQRERRLTCRFAIILLMVTVGFAMAACGGGGGGGSSTPLPPPQSGTTAGTYSVTVTATSGTTTHTTALTLVVE